MEDDNAKSNEHDDNALDIFDLPFPHPQPVIYEDWKAYLDRPLPQRPNTPTKAEFARMSEKEQFESRRQRMIYHATLGLLKTNTFVEISEDFLLTANNNLRAGPGARMGGVIDGLGTLGKTTIMLEIGRAYERQRRRQMRNLLGEDDLMPNGWVFIPVVYIVLPGTTTPKNLLTSLARFYNVPLPTRFTEDFVKGKVLEYARNSGTSLIMVDDVHYLEMKNRTDKDVNNVLKEIANCISATLLYAGIDCDGANLFGEGRSKGKHHFSQTRRRFKQYEVKPYSIKSKEGKQEWLGLIDSFEEQLCLINQKPKSLAKFAEYLYWRTGGSIGALSSLIKNAANLAIKDGGEKLLIKTLDKVKLDKGSEQFYKIYRARKRNKKKK